MDDLDPPREVPGAADGILRTLERFGLIPDEPIVYQSERHVAYAAALEALFERGDAFGCFCTRAQLVGHAVYPGTCREESSAEVPRSVRFRVGTGLVEWEDRWAGPCAFDLGVEVGDFVLKRADGHWAYHLAAVVDDADSGITDVVRGADLLDSTARHIALQRRLGLPTPRYAHLPVVKNAEGQKLSKQTHAPPVDDQPVATVLARVFAHLGLPPVEADRPEAMLAEATTHWKLPT
jgi:glutamyl-Q tRNA(Asp) synthetase